MVEPVVKVARMEPEVVRARPVVPEVDLVPAVPADGEASSEQFPVENSGFTNVHPGVQKPGRLQVLPVPSLPRGKQLYPNF